MTQPSKGAAVFLAVFGLPFFGGGLTFIYAQLVSRGNFKTYDVVAAVLFGMVFVCIGGGLIYAAIRGYGLTKQQAAREEANPLSPWLWRADWAIRRAESQNRKSEILFWALAILCNMITLPFLLGMVPSFIGTGDPRVFLLLGFNLLGAILIVKAARSTIRHRRFGDTYFEFDTLPFSPGEHVSGRIHLKFDTRAEHGIDLRLTCVRKISTGSGNSRSTSQVVLWQADKNVPAEAVGPGPLGRAVPVDFSPPAESLFTNHDNPNDQILWLLHAQADVPGVNYSDDFEIPVFRSAASPALASDFGKGTTTGTDNFGFATSQSTGSDSGEVPQPPHTKVEVSMGSGGTEFYFPAFRNPGRALILLLVTGVWTAVVYALYRAPAPIFFSIAFGFCDLLLIAGTLHVTFGSSLISVRN